MAIKLLDLAFRIKWLSCKNKNALDCYGKL